MEMCGEKLEQVPDRKLDKVDCVFSFHTRIVRQNLRISSVKLRQLLDVCGANGLLSFEFSGSSLKIFAPILLDLLDADSKKARTTRETFAMKSRLEKEEEKEKEIEKENAKTPTEKVVFEIHEDLKGEGLEEVLKKISLNTQTRWIARYKNTAWLKSTLLQAIDYYQTKADQTGEPVTEWGLKLNTWLARDKSRPDPLGKGAFDFNFDQEETA